MRADQVLVGRNNTRRSYKHADAAKASTSRILCRWPRPSWLPAQQPQEGPVQWRAVAGEVARAVEIENHHHAAVAGRRFRIESDKSLGARRTVLAAPSRPSRGSSAKPYDEFDYGYVLTVHKSQGSQWDDVVLFDESLRSKTSRARWLYTASRVRRKRLSVVV